MWRLKAQAFAVAVVGSTLATGAFGETSDWMLGDKALRLSFDLMRGGQIVTKIECKDSGKISLGGDSALVRLTYRQNPQRMAWFVGGWTNFAQAKREAEKDGFRVHQVTSFTRPSGLKYYCMLYYQQ